jgi:hypothetical protein
MLARLDELQESNVSRMHYTIHTYDSCMPWIRIKIFLLNYEAIDRKNRYLALGLLGLGVA